MALIKDILRTMDYGPSPEASDHVDAWLAGHREGFGHFIGGAFVPPASGTRFKVMNPARGTLLAEVADGSAADVDAAVAAAATALPAWSAAPGHVRARHLYALARLV